jgi:hypothetical protein
LRCVKTIYGCTKYTIEDPTKCLECNAAGYKFETNENLTCVSTITKCKQNNINDPSKCEMC